MPYDNISIVYMGTPEFAVPPLHALVSAGFNVKAVVTVADKPSGRGRKINPSAVKPVSYTHLTLPTTPYV